ncbi:copper amine oxidase [Paenibacillus sp. 481]|nr:copper amine oxidase [Paenibacillus sp. 481]
MGGTRAFRSAVKRVPMITVSAIALLASSFVFQATPFTATADAAKANVAVKAAGKQGSSAAVAPLTAREFKAQGISIGMSARDVVAALGEPERKDASEYGFDWYIYNKDYKSYLQAGVSNGKVVALYTNAGQANSWSTKKGIRLGSTRAQVEKAYGKPIYEIKKGNTIYSYNHLRDTVIYEMDGTYTTVFYDKYRQQTVTAVQVIDKQTELGLKGYHGKPSERLRQSYELQLFDLANASRVRFGKKPLVWNDTIAGTARNHSKDMQQRGFFDHTSPDGTSPFDRMEADGISYASASENIAAGQASAIFAHGNWMNSSGHRDNILGDFERMGAGVILGGTKNSYYTQNFYTPLLQQ